jgi:HrpA-like RNA helicase
MPPTLIQRGKIKIAKNIRGLERERINNMVAKDYVMERLADKLNMGNSFNNNIKHWTDKIMILEAFTGSGKTTTIAAEIYKNFYKDIGRNIINTLPLVASVIRTADEVAGIFNMTIGENVGFQTGALKKMPVQGVLYAQIAVLLQQMKIMEPEQLMNKYSIIIIDEVHERNLATDMVLFMLKRLVKEHWDNPRCPHVIFMSATIEMDRFLKYFGEGKLKPEVITVEGMSFPIEQNFLELPAGNYVEKTAEIALEIHKNNPKDFDDKVRDIMIFVYGASPTKALIQIFEAANAELENKIYPLEFSGAVTKAGGKKLNAMNADIASLKINGVTPKRKIIIATPAAETSLTVDTLKYVIDTGLRNDVSWYPQGFTGQIIRPVTQDRAKQRRGRCGRVAPGIWYPVYTKEDFESMPDASFPEIITSEITSMILSVACKNEVFNIHELDMMDQPPSDNLHYSLDKLYALGAIDKQLRPTEVGKLLNKFRKLRIESAKMILSGYHYGSNILDLITIAVMIESKQVLGRKYRPREIIDKKYMNFYVADTFIDLLFLFNQFRDLVNNRDISKARRFCRDNAVGYEDFLAVIAARDELIEDIIFAVGFNPLYNGLALDPSDYNLATMLKKMPDLAVDEIIKLKKCIYSGFCKNLAILKENNDGQYYYMTITGQKLYKIPEGMPRMFLYDSLSFREGFGKYEYTYGVYSVVDNFYTIDLGLN